MKKWLLILLLLPMLAFAETGIYYDVDNSGEGLVFMEDGERGVGFFFTYGADDCEVIRGFDSIEISATAEATAECPVDKDDKKFDEDCEPVTSSVTNVETFVYPTTELDCTLNGQRWFMFADEYKKSKDEYTGTLYIGEGIMYPLNFISPDNPFGYDVGTVEAVGTYVLRPFGEGYQMRVFQLEEDAVLDDGDWLFNTVFDFNTGLFFPE